jgi:hypothetical protein
VTRAILLRPVVGGIIVLVLALAGCHGGREPTAAPARPDKIPTSEPATPTGKPSPPAYQRSRTKGIYLSVMPGENGDDDDLNDPAYRVRGDLAFDGGTIAIGEIGTINAVQVTGSEKGSVNRQITIIGPDRGEFIMYADGRVGPDGFFCGAHRYVFGIAFAPHHPGRKSATLAIGEIHYALTGVGVDAPTDTEPALTPSPSATPSGNSSGTPGAT